MATVNGEGAPSAQAEHTKSPQAADSAEKKRKREEEASHDEPPSASTQGQHDILDILRQYVIKSTRACTCNTNWFRYDTQPSFLDYAFDAQPRHQPLPKKAKLSASTAATTSISTKLADAAYTVLRDLRKDAELVCQQMVTSIRERAREQQGANAGRLMVDDLKQMQKVQAFAQAVTTIVDQEDKYAVAQGQHGAQSKQEIGETVEGRATGDVIGAAAESGTVLTLFGNAPTPRQLFSSHQNLAAAESGPAVKSELPVDEMGLPMGMTATKVVPAIREDSKKGPTFEEAFGPPHSLQQLQPPKSHRRSTTRDDTIPWKFKDQALQRNRKGGYTVQSLTVGDWLGYGGVDSKEDPASPREKRKQRDRALSGSEHVQPSASKESADDALALEEEALFRRAYSSFAPSCDNGKSVVPEQIKNLTWWQKLGDKRFKEVFALDPALADEPTATDELESADDWQPSEDFEKIIEELEVMEEMPGIEPARSKTDIENVLSDVSKLLETLASHQRIRNATLPSATSVSRTPISPAPFLASRIGKPDMPADDEVATYNALRRELAYLILRLPPYAVAKLDGDQLSELGVRKLIPFETKDVKGIMEEDQVARLAKHNAMATAGSIASLTRPGSTSSQHYSSMNQRTPAIGSAANTRYGQSSYSVGRPSVQPSYQRSTSNQSSYGTPTNTGQRISSYNQYSRPAAPQMNGQQYYQRSAQSSGSYGGYNQQTQQRPGYSQPLAQYQQSQAAARNAVAYQANTVQRQQGQSPFNRSASPIKPVSSYQQPGPQRQTNYQTPQQYAQALQASQQGPGSGRSTPANHPSQPQTPVNGYQRPTPQPIAQAPPRAASGTPQPIAQAPPRAASGTPQPPPTQAQAPSQPPPQTNGA